MEYIGQQHFFDPLKPFPNERVIWEGGAGQKAFIVHMMDVLSKGVGFLQNVYMG